MYLQLIGQHRLIGHSRLGVGRSYSIQPRLLLTQTFGTAALFFAVEPPLLAAVGWFGGVAFFWHYAGRFNQLDQLLQRSFAVHFLAAALLAFDDNFA